MMLSRIYFHLSFTFAQKWRTVTYNNNFESTFGIIREEEQVFTMFGTFQLQSHRVFLYLFLSSFF